MPKGRSVNPTFKERNYVQNLVKGMGKAEAYVAAYEPETENMNTISTNATRVFQRPTVQAYYRRLMNRAENEAVMTRAEAMAALSRIGRAKLRDFVDEDGEVRSEIFDESGQELAKLKTIKKEIHKDDGSVIYVKEIDIQLRDPIKAISEIGDFEDWKKGGDMKAQNVTFQLDLGDASVKVGKDEDNEG